MLPVLAYNLLGDPDRNQYIITPLMKGDLVGLLHELTAGQRMHLLTGAFKGLRELHTGGLVQ